MNQSNQPDAASTSRQAQPRMVLIRSLRTPDGVLLPPGQVVRLERRTRGQYGVCDVVAIVNGQEVRRPDVMVTCAVELIEEEPRWVPVPEGQDKFETGTQLRSPEGQTFLVGDVNNQAGECNCCSKIQYETGWQMTAPRTEEV